MAETAVVSKVDRVIDQYLFSLKKNVDELMGDEMVKKALRSGNVAEIDKERRKLTTMASIFGLDFSFPADLPSRPYFSSNGFRGYLLKKEIGGQQLLTIFLEKDDGYQRIQIIDTLPDKTCKKQRTILVNNNTGIFQATLTIDSQRYNLSFGVTGDPFADGFMYQQGMINSWFDVDGNAQIAIGLPFD